MDQVPAEERDIAYQQDWRSRPTPEREDEDGDANPTEDDPSGTAEMKFTSVAARFVSAALGVFGIECGAGIHSYSFVHFCLILKNLANPSASRGGALSPLIFALLKRGCLEIGIVEIQDC